MTDAKMTEVNKATLTSANAAISKGDFEGFLIHCTEDTTWHMLGDKTLTGKAAVREWMKKTYVHPPTFNVANLIAENDFVVAMGEITLTDQGGQETHSLYSDVWRFCEGKLAELRAYVVEVNQ